MGNPFRGIGGGELLATHRRIEREKAEVVFDKMNAVIEQQDREIQCFKAVLYAVVVNAGGEVVVTDADLAAFGPGCVVSQDEGENGRFVLKARKIGAVQKDSSQPQPEAKTNEQT